MAQSHESNQPNLAGQYFPEVDIDLTRSMEAAPEFWEAVAEGKSVSDIWELDLDGEPTVVERVTEVVDKAKDKLLGWIKK